MIRLANQSEDHINFVNFNFGSSIFNIRRSGADKLHFQIHALPYLINEIFCIIFSRLFEIFLQIKVLKFNNLISKIFFEDHDKVVDIKGHG